MPDSQGHSEHGNLNQVDQGLYRDTRPLQSTLCPSITQMIDVTIWLEAFFVQVVLKYVTKASE